MHSIFITVFCVLLPSSLAFLLLTSLSCSLCQLYTDLAVPELAVPELAVPDLAVPDLAVPEQAVPEHAAPDHAAPIHPTAAWTRVTHAPPESDMSKYAEHAKNAYENTCTRTCEEHVES